MRPNAVRPQGLRASRTNPRLPAHPRQFAKRDPTLPREFSLATANVHVGLAPRRLARTLLRARMKPEFGRYVQIDNQLQKFVTHSQSRPHFSPDQVKDHLTPVGLSAVPQRTHIIFRVTVVLVCHLTFIRTAKCKRAAEGLPAKTRVP